jgi:alpha-mannosidase
MSNYWSTNFFSSQGGRLVFHYSIVSNPSFAAAELTRLGMEQMTPLESDRVSAGIGAASPASESYLHVDGRDVALTTWKRAEDGTGTIVRLVELAGREASVDLTAPNLHIEKAQQCSLLEDCDTAIAVTDNHVRFEIKPHQILTLKLQIAPERQ